MAVNPQFSRLLTKLQATGIQNSNPPLYEVIEQLIKSLIQEQEVNIGATGSFTSTINDLTSSLSNVKQSNFLTHTDEVSDLPNSRELLAGNNVVFDDSLVGARTIDVEKEETYITVDDESAILPNSRRLIAGDNITFDTSVANQLELNVAAVEEGYWTILTDGDPTEPELVFSDEGDVISEFIPT